MKKVDGDLKAIHFQIHEKHLISIHAEVIIRREYVVLNKLELIH